MTAIGQMFNRGLAQEAGTSKSTVGITAGTSEVLRNAICSERVMMSQQVDRPRSVTYQIRIMHTLRSCITNQIPMRCLLLLLMIPISGRILPQPPAMAVPAVNQRIVAFVHDREGQMVGRGECWDLAAEALNASGAKWDGRYGFGKVVDWRKEEVLPGDIVQFENVEVEHRAADVIRRERYSVHTAVVMDVHGRGDYTMAHQNVVPVGRKVGLSGLRMADVRSGKLLFHRPLE